MPYAATKNDLALFQELLIGRWSNKALKGSKSKEGSPGNPLSYNVMPLPQDSAPAGYILKNFKYYETLDFHDMNDKATIPSVAKAPNRGGSITQNAVAVFYDQQVRFGEGPNKDDVVHVENGTWISLSRIIQRDGPYPTNPEVPAPLGKGQPSDITVAKQIAVPHGNSILALGGYETIKGNPVIAGQPVVPDAPFPYPIPVVGDAACAHPVPPDLPLDPYTTTDPQQNPDPSLTANPNKPLQDAVDIIRPDCFIHWSVTTYPLVHGEGVVTNIPFEERLADVTEYFADYWLLSTDGGDTFPYLAYTQTMLMDMVVQGHEFTFPHVTCNIVTKD